MALFLKAVRVLLILAALVIAAAPPAVLINLLAGGTGYGLCEEGLAGCDTGFAAGPALALRVFIGLFLVTVGVRLVSRIIARLEGQQRRDEEAAYYDDFSDLQDPPTTASANCSGHRPAGLVRIDQERQPGGASSSMVWLTR